MAVFVPGTNLVLSQPYLLLEAIHCWRFTYETMGDNTPPQQPNRRVLRCKVMRKN